MTEPKYVTRKAGVDLANQYGLPLTLSRVNKDSMDGKGPKPFGQLGPAQIYTAEEFMRYAVERVAIRSPEAAA